MKLPQKHQASKKVSKEISRAIEIFMCKDLHPYSVVKKEDFLEKRKNLNFI